MFIFRDVLSPFFCNLGSISLQNTQNTRRVGGNLWGYVCDKNASASFRNMNYIRRRLQFLEDTTGDVVFQNRRCYGYR